MAVQAVHRRSGRPVPRRTQVGIPFSWTEPDDTGRPVLIDLEDGSYTARAWVTHQDGTTDDPAACTVDGTTATYLLDTDDLATASTAPCGPNVQVVCVAENGTNVLVSDVREIIVGDWPGADTYTGS